MTPIQTMPALFQIIPNCSAPHLQVSSYMTGDHDDFHEDEDAGVNLTAIGGAEPRRRAGAPRARRSERGGSPRARGQSGRRAASAVASTSRSTPARVVATRSPPPCRDRRQAPLASSSAERRRGNRGRDPAAPSRLTLRGCAADRPPRARARRGARGPPRGTRARRGPAVRARRSARRCT